MEDELRAIQEQVKIDKEEEQKKYVEEDTEQDNTINYGVFDAKRGETALWAAGKTYEHFNGGLLGLILGGIVGFIVDDIECDFINEQYNVDDDEDEDDDEYEYEDEDDDDDDDD